MKISEFNISGEPIPEQIADKILEYHITPMLKIATVLNIYPSQKSSYRSLKWEMSKGRPGTSQHVFRGKGATDWTCDDFANNKEMLISLLISETNYTRITIYNSFIHCDYKGRTRNLYKSNSQSQWELIKTL